MTYSYKREREIAIEAVIRAAQLCTAVQAEISPGTIEKKDRSPVTVADFGSQAIVCRALGEVFPDDSIIAEEDSAVLQQAPNEPILEQVAGHVRQIHSDAGVTEICKWIDRGVARHSEQRFWTLDPIDGTKGFLRKQQYAISLALIVDGRIEVGVLGCPNLPLVPQADDSRGAIFVAVRGQGAVALPLGRDGGETPLAVSRQADPAQARFCESVESGHTSHGHAAEVAQRLGMTAEPVRLDSQAKYAVVARGEAEVYLRLPTRADYQEKIWDHAGGVLLVTEAGGTVTDVAGKPLEFSHGSRLSANRGVVVTNGAFHDRMIETLVEVGVR